MHKMLQDDDISWGGGEQKRGLIMHGVGWTVAQAWPSFDQTAK